VPQQKLNLLAVVAPLRAGLPQIMEVIFRITGIQGTLSEKTGWTWNSIALCFPVA
jgi:hypothetical protein